MPKKLTVTTRPVEIKLKPLVVETTVVQTTTKPVWVNTRLAKIRQIQAEVNRIMSDPKVIAVVKPSVKESSD